jgi:4-amino-4-deoxychorismate lyase
LESTLRDLASPELRLIETFGWQPGIGFLRLHAHLGRLVSGAAMLGVPLDPAAIGDALESVGGELPLRVRLTLALHGAVAVEAAPIRHRQGPWMVALSPQRLRSDDPWLRLKTTQRQTYDRARAELPAGVDEALLLNERDELCDGTITTLFADLGSGLVTPPLTSGLLPGVLRAELLASGACRERVLTACDLPNARLFVGNSLRGLMEAHVCASGPGPIASARQ